MTHGTVFKNFLKEKSGQKAKSSVPGLFDEFAGMHCSADFVFKLKTPDIDIYSSERCFYSE